MASGAHDHEEAGTPNAGVPQSRKAQKAFKHLKSHASALANFTLQWQDLEDHIISVQRQIETRLAQCQAQSAAEPEPQEQKAPASPEAQEDGVPDKGVTENAQSSLAGGNSGLIPMKDGKSLLLYIIDHMKNQKVNRADLHAALVGAENCGGVVLQVMREYLQSRDSQNGEVLFDATIARRSCTVLLLEFMRRKPEIEEKVREDAGRFAVQWKEKLETPDTNLFIKYLQAYGLVSDLKEEEIVKLFDDLLHRNDAPETLRSLGFGHKAKGFIQKLIARNKRIEAVNFIYAFEMVNQFSPISLIEKHLSWAKKEAAGARRNGQSAEAWVDAASLECTALSAAMNCIKTHNLESQFQTEALTKRISQLKKHKSDSKKLVSRSQSNTQPQQLSGNKRQSANHPVHPNKRNGKKRHQAAFPKGASQGSSMAPPYSLPTPRIQDYQVAAAKTTLDTAIDSPSERNFILPTYRQPPQPILPHGINISQAGGENGAAAIRNSTLSPTNLLHQPPSSTREFKSSHLTSVTEGLPSIRNSLQVDIRLPRPIPPQYADMSQNPSVEAFPGSRHHPFMGSVREAEGTSSRSGHYRSTGPSAFPPCKYSPTADYEDDLVTSIRSDLAAIRAMKYKKAGSSTFRYAESSVVSSAVPRYQHYLQPYDYAAGPPAYSYNRMSSSQGQLPRYTP